MNDWKKISVVKKGLSHISNGTNCQDNVAISENELFLVSALADGLGSLRYSDLASKIATRAICDFFTSPEFMSFDDFAGLLPHLGGQIVSYVQNSIIASANEAGISISEMDCTLAFVCIAKKSKQALIGLLGDSAICILGKRKSIVINDGNKSANGTYAVLDKDADKHLRIQSVELDKSEILGFILTSDGLENELYMKGSTRISKVAASYFNTLTSPEEAESAIAERIDKITSAPNSPFDDDISIVILSRAQSNVELPSDPTWLCSCGERNPLQNTYCQACHQDFTVLYQKIRFKDYGGKAAFFEKINANPDEERAILGLPTKKATFPDTTRISTVERTNSDAFIPFTDRQNKSKAPIVHTNTQPNASKKTSSVIPLAFDSSVSLKTGFSSDSSETLTQSQIAKQNTGHQSNRSNPSYQVKEGTNMDGRKNTRQKTNYNLPVLLSIIFFVVGIIAGSFFAKLSVSKQINNLSEKIEYLTVVVQDLEKSVSQIPSSDQAPITQASDSHNGNQTYVPNDFKTLSNGDYFWGNTDNSNNPDGTGVLLHEGEYFVGTFENGRKSGKFLIVSSNNRSVRTVLYADDVLVSETDPIEEASMKTSTVHDRAVIREYPSEDSKKVGTLSFGDEVSVFNVSKVNNSGKFWIIVKTSDNLTGWIEYDVIDGIE